jgi:hypothetical protein
MLTLEEKNQQFMSFIKSEKFGLDTWTSLVLFNQNSHNILLTIQLYGIIIKRLDEGDIPNNFTSIESVRIKQHIYMDVIMKIQILIETLLVLIHALSKNYSKVSQILTFYDTKLVRSIIENIRTKKYNIRKVLGLPNLGKLPLTDEQKRFMLVEYAEWERLANEILCKLTNFYEDFRIAYGKSKHGLTFQTGLGFHQEISRPILESVNFHDSLLGCLDRKVRRDMPKRHYISDVRTKTAQYFNAVSYVKFNDKLLNEIQVTISRLKEIIPFICSNHMTYAKNCGESYLPYVVEDGKVGLKMPNRKGISDNENEICRRIINTIIPIMNISEGNHLILGEIVESKIKESMLNDAVTNIWIKNLVPRRDFNT